MIDLTPKMRVWIDSIVVYGVSLLLVALLSWWAGLTLHQEIGRRQAWNLSVQVFQLCDKLFNPLGTSLEVMLKRSGACTQISDMVLNDVYEIRIK